MAKRKKTSSAEEGTPASLETDGYSFSYCNLPPVQPREFGPEVDPDRAELIVTTEKKWVNGTVLHYYFFDKTTDGSNVRLSNGTTTWRTWTTTETEKNVVRQAFQRWKAIGTGLEFKEVPTREEAEIRIGFMRGDGAWSYIGRDILARGVNERTMNFGWDLTRRPAEIDTAIHEIGHTLGFPHEHQNPYAGIVWNEEAVYTSLAQPPNSWSRGTTFHNIIRKITPDTVQGSNWDPNSVMHYPFGPGLIQEPAQYRNGLTPAGGLSERDKTWLKTFYPVLTQADYTELKPLQSVELNLAPQEQRNFVIQPTATRKYEMRTFGESDTVVVLFEDDNGELRYMTGDDDSGENYNAYLKVKLYKGRRYVLRIRLYYAQSGQTGVMLW